MCGQDPHDRTLEDVLSVLMWVLCGYDSAYQRHACDDNW